jgi:hypothetical protein
MLVAMGQQQQLALQVEEVQQMMSLVEGVEVVGEAPRNLLMMMTLWEERVVGSMWW